MEMIADENICQNLREALAREWIDTNGTGSYASSTILNCHTRRYHGLLVANLAKPAGRFVLLSKFEDSIAAQGKEFLLSCHKYPGVIAPRGHHFLREFRQDLFPRFTHVIGDVILTKSLMMVHGENRVLIRYHLEKSSMPIQLRLKPFLAYRSAHDLTHENFFLQARAFSWKIRYGFKITPYNGMPDLFVQLDQPNEFLPSPVWYRNFEYEAEAMRGFEAHEDLFQPGIFEIPMKQGDVVHVSAALAECRDAYARTWSTELKRRQAVERRIATAARAFKPSPLNAARRRLLRSADDFLVTTPDGRRTVIAGYHWFGDWGRDTLIALPGLTFWAGNPKPGVEVLISMAAAERNGLIPNFFGVDGAHAYNSVDASLWFFWAAQQMVKATGDYHVVRQRLWPVMKRILRSYRQGTDFGIGMAQDGLIQAGNALTQLTWMDAMVRGAPVTPRHGVAVEINALWYNALAFADELARRFNEPCERCDGFAAQVRDAFNRRFWLDDAEYLADVVTNGEIDRAVRPNQIFAVSLPHSPLDADRARAVVNRLRRDLLTPFGLRTLAPGHPAYRGRYAGTGEERDNAYHQGTVWPWLLGHFGEALLKTDSNPTAAAAFLRDLLAPLLNAHLPVHGAGHIAEVFDGDPPHFPNGCIAQAWSLAEIIRLMALIDAVKPSTATKTHNKTNKQRRMS